MLFRNQNSLAIVDLLEFQEQLARLLKAGLSLTAALESLKQSYQSFAWQLFLAQLQQQIQAGLLLSAALQQFPRYFSDQVIAFVQCGEKTGHLADVLVQLSQYQRLMLKFKQKAWRALSYPSFILFTSLLMSFAILIWVVPLFAELFKQNKHALPALTEFLLQCSEQLPRFSLISVLTISTGWYLASLLLKTNFYWRWQLSKGLTSCKFLADFIQLWHLNVWLPLMAHQLAAGFPLVEALQAATKIFKQLYYQAAYQQLLNDVAAGNSLTHSMQRATIFPTFLLTQIAIAERTSALKQIFAELAFFYEEELERRFMQLVRFIEPLGLLLISGIIALLIMALYLPIFRMGEMF